MKQVKSLIAMGIVFAILLVVSCKKGDTGPAGPAGATGPAGPTGAKGDTGVANVIYSAWLDASYSVDTVHVGTHIDTVYYYDATVPKLTSAILTTGEIKCYINLGTPTTPTVVPLPYFNVLNDVNEKITPYFFVGGIELDANIDPSTYTSSSGKVLQWRYVLIPGGKAARSAIDWNNYAEVKKYLNLKD